MRKESKGKVMRIRRERRKVKKEERKRKERNKKKEKRKEKEKRSENINSFIQTDGRTDRHKSFIDMRYNTEQYSKSSSIELNRIKSNQIDLKWNKVE